MYPFTRTVHGWLVVHESRPLLGQRHLKAFVTDTAPHDQATLNLYVAGQFEVQIGAFVQHMPAGSSSLDLGISVIPAGAVACEQPLVDGSIRLCLQPVVPSTRWTRRVVDLAAGESVRANDGFVIPMAPMQQSYSDTFTADSPTRVCVVERATATA